MNLAGFKKDIDELLDTFASEGFTGFRDFKQIWLERRFSYIYEGRPTNNPAVFMQGLFAHCIACFVSSSPFSRRLGSLYCLYCLYETQPFKPCFKIYLFLGELKHLKELVTEAKKNNLQIVPALVKRMLEKNFFLFGFVDIISTSVSQRIDEITKLQDKHVQVAFEKLLSNARINEYLHMDLGLELDIKRFKMMSEDYSRAKEIAITNARSIVDVDDIRHIAENKNLMGGTLQKLVDSWEDQKERFYKNTGIIPCTEITVGINDALDTLPTGSTDGNIKTSDGVDTIGPTTSDGDWEQFEYLLTE